jgi:uncharacterized protein (DUF302 family)
MRKFLIAFCLLIAPYAYADNGLVSVQSPHDVAKTVARLKTVLTDKKMTLFAVVDHTAGAKKVGLELRPTVVVIFGNPKGGTPFMQCAQTVGIDLPLKALIWQDDKGQTWFTYNDPQYIADRHGVKDCGEVVKATSAALAGFAKATTQP